MQAAPSHFRKKPFKTRVVTVPDAQWKAVVAYHTRVLHSPPTFTPPGANVDTATDAIWGSGDNELHLVRGAKDDAHYSGDGSEVFSLCKSVEDAQYFFGLLKDIPGAEVKAPFQLIDLLRVNWRGKLKVEHIAYGSVYLAKSEKILAASSASASSMAASSVGASYVEGVIHNPNYPELTLSGAGFGQIDSSVTKFLPLAAAVAGVGLLAGILLGRRSK